ncbi:uncharacterized protein [Amphiura filiformis]|uniref:uncharacterized protein n=1 Tax=Amphiura filiformis TaxID=82378 RepID=UPI003B225210
MDKMGECPAQVRMHHDMDAAGEVSHLPYYVCKLPMWYMVVMNCMDDVENTSDDPSQLDVDVKELSDFKEPEEPAEDPIPEDLNYSITKLTTTPCQESYGAIASECSVTDMSCATTSDMHEQGRSDNEFLAGWMERGYGNHLFKAVQPSQESICRDVVSVRKKGSSEILAALESSLKTKDINKQYECWMLLKCLMGPEAVVNKEPIFKEFQQERGLLCLTPMSCLKHQLRKLDVDFKSLPSSISSCLLADMMAWVTTHRTKIEDTCPAVQDKEVPGVCLLGDEPLLGYRNFHDMGSFTHLPVFIGNFSFLEEARTHHSLYGKLGSNEEVVQRLRDLDSIASSNDGFIPILLKDDSINICDSNLSVKLETAACECNIVTVPGGEQTQGSSPPRQEGSSQKTYAAESTQCGCGAGGATGGGAGNGGNDDNDGWDDKRRKGPKDKLLFPQLTK